MNKNNVISVRPIDANALLQKRTTISDPRGWGAIEVCEAYDISVAPTLDYAPITHAKWIDTGNFEETVYGELRYCMCSHCEETSLIFLDDCLYCPKCGAKMDFGDDNNDT